MTDTPPPHLVAQQFLDFWQEQTRRTMQDERFLTAMMEMMSSMPPPQHFSTTPPYASTSSQPHSHPYAAHTAPHHPNTQQHAAAATNDARAVELAELLRRVERCEARIGTLEDALRAANARNERVAEPPAHAPTT
jgi:hypothetical protein